jgi:hypothetical protein
MCIKNHTHCSVESVTERRQQPLPCRLSFNRSTGCRRLKPHTRLLRVSEDRGTPFRDGLKTCCSEVSTAQHIICNTNRAVWSPLVLRKLLSNTHPGAPLPLTRPSKKNIHNLPKNASPSRPPHHRCTDPGTDSLSSPHVRINCTDLAEDSCRDE